MVGPGWLGHALHDEFTASGMHTLRAGGALENDYHAVIDAGFTLQIDDPALCTRNTVVVRAMSRDGTARIVRRGSSHQLGARRKSGRARAYPTCWGSFHTPQSRTCLEWVVDLLPKLNVGAYSVEAADVRHELDFNSRELQAADGKSYYPGVIAHKTSTVEPPELVAYRIVRYAKLLGKEKSSPASIAVWRVLLPRRGVGQAQVARGGARLASHQLWG